MKNILNFKKMLLYFIFTLTITFQIQSYADDNTLDQVKMKLDKLYKADDKYFSKNFQSYKEIKKLNLQTGDIIGISETLADPSTIFFESGTGSRYGHVGIIVKEKLKESDHEESLLVYHANVPIVQKTSLKSFIGRSAKSNPKGLFTIVRLKVPLSDDEKIKLVSEMTVSMFKPTLYNSSQVLNDETVNCSEFVYKSFQKIGRNVGSIQKMKDLNLAAFNLKLINAYSYGEPTDCEAEVVTPLSVIRSETTELVYSSTPNENIKNYSDFELLSIWTKEGSLDLLKQLTELPVEELGIPSESISKDVPFLKPTEDQLKQICLPTNN